MKKMANTCKATSTHLCWLTGLSKQTLFKTLFRVHKYFKFYLSCDCKLIKNLFVIGLEKNNDWSPDKPSAYDPSKSQMDNNYLLQIMPSCYVFNYNWAPNCRVKHGKRKTTNLSTTQRKHFLLRYEKTCFFRHFTLDLRASSRNQKHPYTLLQIIPPSNGQTSKPFVYTLMKICCIYSGLNFCGAHQYCERGNN